jgi:hypothetical protein
MNKSGKRLTKADGVRWVFALGSLEVFPVDRHGRQVAKAVKVFSVQEAHDICEGRNKASGNALGA